MQSPWKAVGVAVSRGRSPRASPGSPLTHRIETVLAPRLSVDRSWVPLPDGLSPRELWALQVLIPPALGAGAELSGETVDGLLPEWWGVGGQG